MYGCDQCGYKATPRGHLRMHKQSRHEGVRCNCDQCDYESTNQWSLKKTKESKHEGVRYGCDQCYYKATQQGSLKIHKHSKHEGFMYGCDQSAYKITWQLNIKSPNMKVWSMYVISVALKLHYNVILRPTNKTSMMVWGMDVTSVNKSF